MKSRKSKTIFVFVSENDGHTINKVIKKYGNRCVVCKKKLYCREKKPVGWKEKFRYYVLGKAEYDTNWGGNNAGDNVCQDSDCYMIYEWAVDKSQFEEGLRQLREGKD